MNFGSENYTTSLRLAGAAEARGGDLVSILLEFLPVVVLILFRDYATALAPIRRSLRLQACYTCHSLIGVLTVHLVAYFAIGVSARTAVARLGGLLLYQLFAALDLST